jgi:hypothetical protein
VNIEDRVRFARQIRVPEIGLDGQERLCQATALLGGAGLAGELERTYLKRCGVRLARESRAGSSDVSIDELRNHLGIRHEVAAEIAEGSLRALMVVRSIVLGPGP